MTNIVFHNYTIIIHCTVKSGPPPWYFELEDIVPDISLWVHPYLSLPEPLEIRVSRFSDTPEIGSRASPDLIRVYR